MSDHILDSLEEMAKQNILIEEQAQRLGITVAQVKHRRRKLIAAKRITVKKHWTEEELFKLEIYRDEGLTPKEIARRLKRSVNGVQIKGKRAGIPSFQTDALKTATDVARTLGIKSARPIVDWIDRGWLKAKKVYIGTNAYYRISDDDLMAMMQNEETWMAWHPEHITDLYLQEWAVELCAGKPQWLTSRQVAEMKYVSILAVNHWVRQEYLPSVRYYNNWIREDVARAFVVPSSVNYHQRTADLAKQKKAA